MTTVGHRMSDKDWAEVMECSEADHRIARMIAEEYTWGWATCWFAETGEFGHGMMNAEPTYARSMIRHLFTWWQTGIQEVIRGATAQDRHAENLMANYLREREEANDVGPVQGFRQLWPTA